MNGCVQLLRIATIAIFVQFGNLCAADCAQTLYGFTVNEPDFADIPNVQISAVYPDIPPIETTSGANGYFELCVPARNDGKLIVTGASAVEFISQTLPFTMSPSNSYGVMFAVMRATNQISGRVRTTTGQGIPNALVMANLNLSPRTFQIQTRADAEGRYTLRAGRGGWVVFSDCIGVDTANFFCPNSTLVTIDGTNATHDIVIWPTTPANAPTLTGPRIKIVNGQPRFAFTIRADPGYYELYESQDLFNWEFMVKFGYPQPATDEMTRDVISGPSRYYKILVSPPP